MVSTLIANGGIELATRIARALNLIAVGLLSGNEFGSLLNVHPAFDDLDPPTRIRAEQAITRRYGKAMPFFMVGTIASYLPVLALDRRQRRAPFLPSAAGLACYLAMLAVPLIGNMPINKKLLALDPETTTDATFDELRTRWTRLHLIRNALNISGLVLTVTAVLERPARQS